MLATTVSLLLLHGKPLQEFAAKYGVETQVLSQPLVWHGEGYTVSAKPPTQAQMDAYRPLFESEWSLYPPSLMQKVHLDRIVFGVDLAVGEQKRAAVPAFDGNTMYYDPALGSHNAHYQRVVVHHEFFHMLDERMGLLYYDPVWAVLNPKDFSYGSGGAKMRTSGVGELTSEIAGFLTQYGTSAVEEDKAELFAHMIVDAKFVRDLALKDPHLAWKIHVLKQRVKRLDPAMDEAFWARASRE